MGTCLFDSYNSYNKDPEYQVSNDWMTIWYEYSYTPLLAVISTVYDSMRKGLLEAPCLEIFQYVPHASLPLADFSTYLFHVINYIVNITTFSESFESLQ